MNELIEQYNKAKKDLFDHVGFVPDWVVCPVDDCTGYYWRYDGSTVTYAEAKEQFNTDGDFYQDSIYTQRFYKQWAYRGEKLTMIMCDPHADGMKWFRFFSNHKEIKP